MSNRKGLYVTIVVVFGIVGTGLLFGLVTYRISRSALAGDGVDKRELWIETVKKGTMDLHVLGDGTLRSNGDGSLFATVEIAEADASKIQVGQSAWVYADQNTVPGKVIHIRNDQQGSKISIDVSIDKPDPKNLASGGKVRVFVYLGTVENAVYVGRPWNTHEFSTASLYKLEDNGKSARMVHVKFGNGSVNDIEVLDGLKPGDQVIISDVSNFAKSERIRIY